LTGDNGLLKKANEAKIKKEISEERELIQLAYQATKIEKHKGVEKTFVELFETELEINGLLGAKVYSNKDSSFSVKVKDKVYDISVNGQLLNEGNSIATTIRAENFGEKINYSVNGIKDWKIFYNDGNNVFIISSDYISKDVMPTNIEAAIEGTHQVYWENPASLSYIGAKSIEKEIAKKYMLNWVLENENSENPNIKAVASLMNTEKWDCFITPEIASKGGTAIGGPTLEMFLASWNAKGYTRLYCNNSNLDGYYIGTEDSPLSKNVDIIGDTEGYKDKLYFPYKDNYNGCDGYWISTPSAHNKYSLTYVNYVNGYIGTTGAAYKKVGIRPVVCLPDNIIIEKDENTQIWNIK